MSKALKSEILDEKINKEILKQVNSYSDYKIKSVNIIQKGKKGTDYLKFQLELDNQNKLIDIYIKNNTNE